MIDNPKMYIVYLFWIDTPIIRIFIIGFFSNFTTVPSYLCNSKFNRYELEYDKTRS